MRRSLGEWGQIIPHSSGGLPRVWVPHGYNGCRRHGPDEHVVVGAARWGDRAFAGFWWALGEAVTPA